jgi:selenocysteine lyase/cysteine desulfurase
LALTMASNAFGTMVPLSSVIASAKKISPRCLVCVDAVHHSVHGSMDVQAAGCDFLAFSGYKMFGPMLGILWGRRERLSEAVPYRVETSKNTPPVKFELGMLNNPVLAGFAGAMEYLLWLGERIFSPEQKARWNRKQLFHQVMRVVETYDLSLGRMVLEGFQKFDSEKFLCYGLNTPEEFDQRDPTFAFDIKGLSADTIKARLWESQRIQIGSGNHYSAAVYRILKRPSLARVSFCHYDSPETVQAFLNAVDDLIETH